MAEEKGRQKKRRGFPPVSCLLIENGSLQRIYYSSRNQSDQIKRGRGRKGTVPTKENLVGA